MDISSDESESGGERNPLRRFIQMYESLPQLWNASNPLYKCKTNRNAALNQLVPLYAHIKPGATRDDVKKKINSLRTNFRTELKKVLASERSGAAKIYEPKSWTYHALEFLRSCERDEPSVAVSNANSKREWTNGTFDNEPECQLITSVSEASSPARSSIAPVPVPAKRRILAPSASSDQMPTIAIAWGEKLMTLERTQRLYAEKIINDVLFEASFGNLNRNSLSLMARPTGAGDIDGPFSEEPASPDEHDQLEDPFDDDNDEFHVKPSVVG